MSEGGGEKKADDGKGECVRVIVRCRPFNSKEKKEGNERAVFVNTKDHTIEVRDCANPKLAPKRWTFDGTFDENCQQRDIYDSAAAAIVDDVLSGFNGTIFAYGQTGACMRACLRACMRACMRACVHGCVRACTRACLRAGCLPAVALRCFFSGHARSFASTRQRVFVATCSHVRKLRMCVCS
jgi:hypothetical protein